MPTMDPRSLGDLQLDALREAANIGAGHAATALSQITNRRVMIQVPDVAVLPLESVGEMLGDPGEVVCAVIMTLHGGLEGRTLQVFPERAAARLTAKLLRTREPLLPSEFGLLERSTLKEVGNILLAAYLNALAQLTGSTLTMSTPAFALDMAAAVLTTTYLNFDDDEDCVFCVSTRMAFDRGEDMPAHFLLIPDRPSLQSILRALQVA
jgi:chemotaxis protein CheC